MIATWKACLWLGGLGALAACGPGPSAHVPPPAVDAGMPVYVSCDQLDVLFVIDNSPSMAQEQANLAANFDAFLKTLREFRGGGVDFRIGVTTTAFPTPIVIVQTSGAAGALLKTPEMAHPWLDADDPDLEAKFKNLATVGTDSTGSQQPLRAAQGALTPPLTEGENAGFLRRDALLALVFITNQDDLSNTADNSPELGNPSPVQKFIDSFDRIKGDRSYWSAAVIAGGAVPICKTPYGDASYAARLRAFVQQTGPNAIFSSICDANLSKSLVTALKTFGQACDQLVI